MRLAIVSGTNRPRLTTKINHKFYADRHGYDYLFDTARYWFLPTPHYRKLRSVGKALGSCDWAFWLDDDAMFTDFDTRLETFLVGIPDDVFLVICSSPVSPHGKHTFISSGQFFLRNCSQSQRFLQRVLGTRIGRVRSWWDQEKYGQFTKGDQDAIVYVLVTENLLDRVRILPFEAFNCRSYHYKLRLNEHFLVHFPGVADKRVAIAQFAGRFGFDDTLTAKQGLLRNNHDRATV